MQSLKQKLGEKINFDNENQHENIEETGAMGSNLIVLDRNNQDSVVPKFEMSISEVQKRVLALQQFVNEIMIPDVDYGLIPGCKKPSLFKSGAEKLCDVFGFSKHVEVINRVEDWDSKIFHYEIKVTLINKRTGLIEAEGVGSCNNRESKYVKQDPYNILNTLLKMAKKRAIVDAVLSATRSSGLFTQDLEDIKKEVNIETEHLLPSNISKGQSTNKGSFGEYQSKEQTESKATKDATVKLATVNQLNLIIKLVKESGMSLPEIKDLLQTRYHVDESKYLSTKQASDLIKHISSMNG
jgi:hypothetical protein